MPKGEIVGLVLTTTLKLETVEPRWNTSAQETDLITEAFAERTYCC